MNTLEPEPDRIILQLILVALFIAINAFLVAAEMAIISVNKTKVKKLSEDGNKRAKLLEKLMDDPSNFLSTIQIATTLAGFLLIASVARGISTHLPNDIRNLNFRYIQEGFMIGIILILSYFTLVFGRLVPKRIGLKKSEKIALFSSIPIYFIFIITKPFIKILTISTSVVIRLTGNEDSHIEETLSEEEILFLISKSQQDGCIEYDEKEMINGVFEFNDKIAREIMTSRKDTFTIDIEDDINCILDNLSDLKYSRIPVYEKSIDNIIGILYVKDLIIEARKVGFENLEIRKILHKPYFVPETKRANELFKMLQVKRVHLALLVDEYGGFAGIVTMEDLIEEIMGRIEDEYDMEESRIKKIDDKNFIVKGFLTINDFNDMFGTTIEQGDYDTLSGYIINTLGEIPNGEEDIQLDLDKLIFKLVKINNRRIEDIQVSLLY